MAEKTKAKSDTSEADGKKTEGEAEGEDTQTPKTEDNPKQFTQDDLDAIAKKVRKEEKDKYDKSKAEEKRIADENKAKEAGEFEKLANDRQKQLEEVSPKLEAATKELESYKLAVAQLVKAELKTLPEEVRDISPAQYAEDKSLTNPLDVLAWIPKGKVLAAKLDGAPAKPGAGLDPKAKSAPGEAEKDKQAQAAMATHYRTF